MVNVAEKQEVKLRLFTINGKLIQEKSALLNQGQNEIGFEGITEPWNVFLVEMTSKYGIKKLQKAVRVNR